MGNKLTVSPSSRIRGGVSLEGSVSGSPLSVVYYPSGEEVLMENNLTDQRLRVDDYAGPSNSQLFLKAYAVKKAVELLGDNGYLEDAFIKRRSPKVVPYSSRNDPTVSA